jgi:outer membrane lipoprotein carrier protein
MHVGRTRAANLREEQINRSAHKSGSAVLWRLAAFAVIAVLCGGHRAAGQAQPDSAELVRRVDDHYNHLRTLRARYIEQYAGMGLTRSESGTLTLKKPGLMRWSYDKPAGKVFVLDGHYAWFYTPGDAQVSRTPAKQLDDLRSPLRFLLGRTELAKELDMIATVPEGASFKITGIPKGMAQRVRLLTLIVTPACVIQDMKIEETDGSTTDFTFSEIEENVAIPASDFVFTPPKGIPVVDGQAPI